MQAGLPARLQAPGSLLAALRESRRSHTTRQGGRVKVAVAERSELRAAGGGGPPPPPLPSGAELLQKHLTAQQRECVTHDILHGFLAADVSSISSSNGHHGRRSGAPHRSQPPRRGRAARSEGGGSESDSGPQRGLQGRIAEHLLTGGFDEALLEPVPTHTLNWVVKVLGEQQQAVLAEQLFHWMRLQGKANQHSFVKLCEACAACRQPWRAAHAWRTVRRMPQAGILGSHAAAALILTYRSTADCQGALAALETLQASGVPLNRYAYNAAIRVCADAGAADEALRLLGTLRQLAAEQQPARQRQQPQHQQPQAPHWRQPAEQQRAEAAWQQQAEQLWPAAQQAAQQAQQQPQRLPRGSGDDELRTDCRSYSAALAALAAAGRWHRAAQLQRWMAEDGVVPDAHLCTQLLSCYASVGDAGAARRLLDAMAAGAGPPPNRSHWNAALLAYAEARDAPGCAAAYRSMQAAGLRPDCATLVAVLRAAFHARLGLGGARAVRAEMRRLNIQANNQLATALLCCLRHVAPDPDAPPLHLAPGPLQQQAPQEQQQAQQEQQQAQQEQQEPPAAADERAACLAEAAAVVRALRRQWGRTPRPLDTRLYNAWMGVQLAAGDWAAVLQTFRELEAEETLLPDGDTLATVITACRQAGWKEQEAEFHALLQSSRLLGSLGGDAAVSAGGWRRRGRRSHRGSGRHARPPAATDPADE